MSHRRTAGRLPLEQPLLVEEQVEDTWAKWFTTVSDNTYRYDKYAKDMTGLPASVPANSTYELIFDLSGVASNDFVTVSKPTHQTGLGIVNVRVDDKDRVAITYINTTGGAITPADETYTIKVEKI